MKKLKVGILGATGMVGQRFITLLQNHPWFELVLVAASEQSAGKTYEEAVRGRWVMSSSIPDPVRVLTVKNALDVDNVASEVDFVFSAIEIKNKDDLRELEESYARAETFVISNNSAHRWTVDVPMLIPEVNFGHISIIVNQRRRLRTKRGGIVVKPNCSTQGFVMALHPLLLFGINRVHIATYQAVSGSGKTLATWPEMEDNVIPYIDGEERKCEEEPLKLWGHQANHEIISASWPIISAHCVRVPVSDGHSAAVSVGFDKTPPSRDEVLEAWADFTGVPQAWNLPSAPKKPLLYLEDDSRPQTRLDRDNGHGMSVTVGRLREDPLFHWKFFSLVHNTIRGAAGGAILVAELLMVAGFLEAK